LSLARAETVAKALIHAGVNADRVHAEGYGSQKPMAGNSTALGRAQNRHLTLEVSPQ
jgi:outer membrane protein OmpA-like peptidoglycan-associated protein